MRRISGPDTAVPRLALVGFLVMGAAALPAFQKADPASFNGTWTLDVAASTNPNGPTASTPGPRMRGGGGGGGSTGGGDAGGGVSAGGPPPGGALGAGEKARFYAMLSVLEHAPATLVIAATDKDVTLTADGSTPIHHMTNGKTEKLPTGNEKFGNLEIKTKWDGASLKREIKTIDGLTVAETYSVAEGGKLMVSLELKSQVERLADGQRQPIKRIYTRAR